MSPLVNNSDWSKEEAKKLMKLGKQFGGRNWKGVVEGMGVSMFGGRELVVEGLKVWGVG